MAVRLLKLKKLIFISMGFFEKKKALLEMKMRCVNPAGFPPKWLRGISMHGLGKRWPEAPRFNYDFRRVLGKVGVAVGVGRWRLSARNGRKKQEW